MFDGLRSTVSQPTGSKLESEIGEQLKSDNLQVAKVSDDDWNLMFVVNFTGGIDGLFLLKRVIVYNVNDIKSKQTWHFVNQSEMMIIIINNININIINQY